MVRLKGINSELGSAVNATSAVQCSAGNMTFMTIQDRMPSTIGEWRPTEEEARDREGRHVSGK